jgi:dipeptidyl aminopeptidase/acylaminoacyl peptidase
MKLLPLDWSSITQETLQSLPLDIQKSTKDKLDLLDLYDLTYDSDGRKIKGYIVKPKAEGIYPCIIYNRGGSREYGVIGVKHLMGPMSTIASWGYVVVASQYSGNAGSDGKDELSGMDLEDIINLKPVIDSLDYVDSTRIGMTGASRGGVMSLNILRKSIDWIRCVSIQSSLLDIASEYISRPKLKEFQSDMYDTNSDELVKAKSPYQNVDEIDKTIPLQIIQGGKDINVMPSIAVKFFNKLIEAGHNSVDFYYFSEADHGLSQVIKESNTLKKEFFAKWLKK